MSTLCEVLDATTLESLHKAKVHDVIIVGAGAAGGLAAMLLAEGGLRVLVLDASKPTFHTLREKLVQRLANPPGLSFLPPALVPKARHAALRVLARWRQPIQSQCMTWEFAPSLFVDDRDCPYVTPPDRPFIWVRARTLGGRLAVPTGQQYYRLGPDDFSPLDGLSTPWPLQPNELDPWYALVERRLGLSGMRDGLRWLPDGEIKNHLSPTQTETELRSRIVARWPGARPILGRFAPPVDALEAAARTGRLQCRQGAIVREIRVDSSGSVSGVVWVDDETGNDQEAFAPLVFLCASALESTRILMLSSSQRHPLGLGGSSSALGCYLMDHVLVTAEGSGPPQSSPPPWSMRCLYLPRFDSRECALPKPGRGYGVQVYQFSGDAGRPHFEALSFGEMTPRPENRVRLHPTQRDAWGIPILRIECAHNDAELARARDQMQALRELADLAEVDLKVISGVPAAPGSAYHECGTARMGTDQKSSVLDVNNQCWDARGLYVTDAACFPSQGIQNPTLTILALTARACHHALNSSGAGFAPKFQ
jgi:choline dehydrogenase-like flavoprotein